MGSVLVCLPAARGDRAGLVEASSPWQAFSATPALLETLGYTPEMDEEADYGALVLASVAALLRFGERFVVTAQVEPSQVGPGEETANGGVAVTGLRRDQLVAYFARPDEDPRAAASAAAGCTLDEAWELPEVAALLENELLWHDIEEWGR